MAGNFSKRGFTATKEDKLPFYVVLFISRNKDNKDVPNFKERRISFTTHHIEKAKERFKHFVEDGVDGETCRLYISVNARDEDKVRKVLLHELIDRPDFPLTNLEPLVASIAARKENAAEKKWLFDFDIDDEEKADEFIADIPVDTTSYKTPHGFAIVCEKGFDTRPLMEKWNKDVTLKRDDLLLIEWKKNHEHG